MTRTPFSLILHLIKSKKLLLLIPVHMGDPEGTADQCRFILEKFVSKNDFKVVLLKGTGDDPAAKSDIKLIRTALTKLGGYNNSNNGG